MGMAMGIVVDALMSHCHTAIQHFNIFVETNKNQVHITCLTWSVLADITIQSHSQKILISVSPDAKWSKSQN